MDGMKDGKGPKFMRENPIAGEYNRAVDFLETMGGLRRTWALFHPSPPVNRGDLMLLATADDLARGGQVVTVSLLARRMHQSLPGVSQKISGLEQGGFLRRTASPHDRRVSCIELTEKGRAVADEALRTFLRRIERALNELGADETAQFLQLMRQLTAAMDRILAEAPGAGPPGGPECIP